MNISRNIRLTTIGCFLSLLLVACTQSTTQTAQPEGIVKETIDPHRGDATVTLATSPTLAPEPVQLPVGQSTPSDNSTATVVVTPTWSPQQIPERVRQLLTENAGCALPCWWGIEPEKTTWEEAKAILAPLALQIGAPQRLASQIAYDVLVPVPVDVFPTRLEQRYVVRDGVVQSMEVMPGEVEVYQLSELLAELGQPQEVWVKTYAQEREGSLPFLIVLYYPNRGVLVSLGTEANVEGEYIVACPQADWASYLVLWSPENLLTLQEVVDSTLRLEPFERWQYQQLEATTNLDTASFFETFSSSNNAGCIKSKATHWPMP